MMVTSLLYISSTTWIPAYAVKLLTFTAKEGSGNMKSAERLMRSSLQEAKHDRLSLTYRNEEID